MTSPITKYIERNGSRLIISEHESECFIATEKPMFLDLKALDALLEEAWAIRRRLRAKKKLMRVPSHQNKRTR